MMKCKCALSNMLYIRMKNILKQDKIKLCIFQISLSLSFDIPLCHGNYKNLLTLSFDTHHFAHLVCFPISISPSCDTLLYLPNYRNFLLLKIIMF